MWRKKWALIEKMSRLLLLHPWCSRWDLRAWLSTNDSVVIELTSVAVGCRVPHVGVARSVLSLLLIRIDEKFGPSPGASLVEVVDCCDVSEG